MTKGKGSVQYRKYKERIEYIYQILKLISIKPLSHSKLKNYTDNSNSEAFKRHISPLVQHEYLTKMDSGDYRITAKGREFLDKLEEISTNLIELNHTGFTDEFITEFIEYQASRLKQNQ